MYKKKALFMITVALVLFFGMSVYIAVSSGSYTVYFREPESVYFSDVDIDYSEKNIVSNEKAVHEDGYIKIKFSSLNKGQTVASVTYTDTNNNFRAYMNYDLHVGIFNILYENAFVNIPNISAYPAIYITVALFFCIMAVYMIINFRKSLKKHMYSYETVFHCSLMIIFTGLAIFFTTLSTHLLFNYRDYQAQSMQDLTVKMMMLIIFASVPFVLVYSLSMTISNISLIRHEGFRVANALGIVISVLLTSGVVLCVILPFRIKISNVTFAIVYSIICSIYVFFEIYLLSTKICALIAAKHQPKLDKDYIIILGCGIRKDGTLLPLLKGRVDRAIEFYNKQLEATGKKAVFVPSGGQGSDEIISEGEAMKRYLIENGIPEEQIMPETKSTNTLQNMKFSKELIGDSNANVAFSTTNYHVFRSGIFAGQAGLKAEGMGSKTKWYFWPNAFIREFVGLIVSQKKKVIALFLVAAALSVCSAILTL